MSADSVLRNSLGSRGFTVLHKLTGAGTCEGIFCVSATKDPSAKYCAAKVVNLSGLDPKGRAAAEQEVSFLKGIAPHPNLIGFCDSFMSEKRLIIVMSLAEDGDLRLVVKESLGLDRSIPEPVALSWLRQLLVGLRHMHDQAVLHRDLKSSNIFLSEGRRQLQIGDFGISKVLESMSCAESQVGTPAYMAPEIMLGETYDYHADMWAVGCICYELCTLRPPFFANSIMEIFSQITEEEPDWAKWTGFSDELLDVTKRLLQKEPSSRPVASALLKEALFADVVVAPEVMWQRIAPKHEFHPPIKGGYSDGKLERTSLSNASTTIGSSIGSPSTLDQGLNMSLADFQSLMSSERELISELGG